MAFKLESSVRDPESLSDFDTDKMSARESGKNQTKEEHIKQDEDPESANDQATRNRSSRWNPVNWLTRTCNFLRTFRTFDTADIKDATMGVVDGITVPFALTAGLSSIGSSNIVIIAGLAELISGALSMGSAAYLSATAEEMAVEAEEGGSRALKSAVIMTVSYLMGGIIPMVPYFTQLETKKALFISIGIAASMLLSLGYAMGYFNLGNKHSNALYVAFKTLLIGGAATGASYGIIKGFCSKGPIF